MDDLRLLMRIKKIATWKVAKVIGVSEMTIYRWLRVYDSDHYNKILNAIGKIERGEDHDEDHQEGK